MSLLILGAKRACTSRITRSDFCPRNLSWMSGIFEMAKNVVKGDETINPKKLLERRYLYFALHVIHYQNWREKKDPEAFEKATDALDQLNVDGMTNVDLRLELQKILEPKVVQVVKVFQEVDDQLGLSNPPDNIGELFEGNRGNLYRETLEADYKRTRGTHGYLAQTKIEALELVMSSLGWSQKDLTSRDVDAFGMHLGDANAITTATVRRHQALNLCRNFLIKEKLGYSILCLRSDISGRGLFCDGNAMAGAIMGFQPGDVWPKEHLLTDSIEVMEHFQGDEDCHTSLRFDDYVLDSRKSPVTVLAHRDSRNPWALAHMANHPRECLPNAQSTMLNFPKRLGIDRAYIPNQYARPPTWQSRFFDFEEMTIHGLCLIASRDVANEEIVYDYRLQSDDTPDWYKVVHYGNEMDDFRVVFFRDDWRDDSKDD